MGDTTVVIVGVSKGFGRDILEQCLKSSSSICSNNTCTNFILITSNAHAARNAWESLFSDMRGLPYSENEKNANVLIKEADLPKPECIKYLLVDDEIKYFLNKPVTSVYVYMVAGSVAPVGPLLSSDGSSTFFQYLEAHLSLNLLSFTSILRAIIVEVLSKHSDSPLILGLVNVSSLAAIKELHGMAVYCAVKAARDSLMRSIGSELERDYPYIDARVMSYAPGMMETDMVKNDLLGAIETNAIKELSSHKFVSCSASAQKCVDLIMKKSTFTYKNGQHIDYYDVYFAILRATQRKCYIRFYLL